VKHDWQRTPDGEVDEFAFDYEEPEGLRGHNGPRCQRCHRVVCHHCVPNYDDEECPADPEVGWLLEPDEFCTRED
jgi:hypothetical protein